MPVLLVIDDEPTILHAFRKVFVDTHVELLTSGSGKSGLQLVAERRPDVVILDLELPDMAGMEVFRRIRDFDKKIPTIFITGHGTTETAIEATKLGAYDYLFKPLELEELREVVSRAIEISRMARCAPVVDAGEPADSESDVLVGRCRAMKEVYVSIGRVAPQDDTVLILGESGTGKELVARAIYHHSLRAAGPFQAVNCAAIPETLLESELFGHEKGAFTGAERLRIGKFEQASGGSVFLDEIGDMTPLTQAKILRFLQDQKFERLGGNETVQADVRVIAATNCDLAQSVADCDFRPDLYYRLSVITIRLPPLRERGDDIRLLNEHFVRRFSRQLGRGVPQISDEVHDLFAAYSWPGNIRELQSVVKQTLLRTSGPVIMPAFVPAFVRNPTTSSVAGSESSENQQSWESFIHEQLDVGTDDLYCQWQAITDRFLLTKVMLHARGNLSKAARVLGINRRTLRSRLASLRIEIPLDD